MLFTPQQASGIVASYEMQEQAAQQVLQPQEAEASSPPQTTVPVPERTGPPDTVSSMKTGYVVALAIFFAYIVLLMRRVASVRKQS